MSIERGFVTVSDFEATPTNKTASEFMAEIAAASQPKPARKRVSRRRIAEVLDAHTVTYREHYWDGWDCHYRAYCDECGDLPEETQRSDHQAKVLAKLIRKGELWTR